MLHKIVKLNNVKQLNHISPPDHGFESLNLIYGNNGAGKSTVCKIFNMLNERDYSLFEKLKSIEATVDDQVELNFLFKAGDKNKSILNGNLIDLIWRFRVFNQDFIDNNVYTGSRVVSNNLKNYHDFCLGDASVDKQKEINDLKLENASIINPANLLKTRVESRFNSGLDIKSISKIKIKNKYNADEELNFLNKRLSDLSDISVIKARPKPKKLTYEIPVIDFNFFDVSLDEVSKEAKLKVDEHIAKNLKERDVGWLEEGFNLVAENEACPFCAQPLRDSSVFSMYKDFLGNEYERAVSKFESDSSIEYLKLSKNSNDFAELKNIVSNNKVSIDTWRDKIEITDFDFDNTAKCEEYLDLLAELDRCINKAMKDIFHVIDYKDLQARFEIFYESIDFKCYNEKIEELNNVISDYLLTLDKTTSMEVQAKINDIENYKLRFQQEIIDDLCKYSELEKKRKENESRIKVLRDEIATEQALLITWHKDEINKLLVGFNSNIKIVEIDRDNRASGGNARFKFKIAFLGRELSLENESESNFLLSEVLSMGDKSALALAFFISKFKEKINDTDIIVFDDPMSSLDSHRRNKTIVELTDMLSRGKQLFVFSHDASFLTDMKKYSGNSTLAKCFELTVSITDLDVYDVESSKVFKSKIVHRNDFDSYVKHSYELEYKTLYDFVASPSEDKKVAIARLIRPILEAYMRLHLPNHFTEGHWLGQMISMIRNETNVRSPLYDGSNCLSQIEEINEFSKTFHHAEGFDTKISGLNVQELQEVAKKTLTFITGI